MPVVGANSEARSGGMLHSMHALRCANRGRRAGEGRGAAIHCAAAGLTATASLLGRVVPLAPVMLGWEHEASGRGRH